MALSSASANVRGMFDMAKRRELFHYYNIKPYQVIFLQEMHCTGQTEPYWRSEWGHNMYLSYGSSEARGAGILIKSSCQHIVHNLIPDPGGRFVIMDVSFGDFRVTLVNLYGPNSDSPEFFKNIIEIVDTIINDKIIIGADFNCIINNNMDKQGGKPAHSNKQAQEVILNWIEDYALIDIWRNLKPNKKVYTWSRKKPFSILCRLDFFLISEGLTNFVKSAKIKTGIKSDHSLIDLIIETTFSKRGPGFWKFNNSYLQDPEYIILIKKTIKETVNDNFDTDPCLLWDTIKCMIWGASIKYGSRKARERNKEIFNLEEQISEIINQDIDLTEESEKKLEKLQQELVKKLEFKTSGAVLRNKCRYAEFGEKNTAYFLNLEKRNSVRKSINKIQLDNGETSSEAETILQEFKLFYSKLYTAERLTKDKNLIENFFEGMPKLTDEISNQCDGDLTEDEIFQCLNTFPNGKSPGTDGLSVEWYKRFWPDIKDSLLKSINFSVQNGHLSLTKTQGIITVIPKKDKDPLFVKNWRPISLLNQDYKLIAKCIANRIKSTLPYIIHEDQTGFMKNRYIGENLIKIFALMTYSKQKDLKNYLVTIHFEKAFDYLDKEYIFFCLKFFNFGADIINWVKILYNNSNSCVINNGNFT